MQHVHGSVEARSNFLRGLEEQKRYPPRLSLRVVRPHEVQQDLESVVTVDGVVTEDDMPLRFTVFAQAPPSK